MATIKDVARLAGVGVGTASRVVSGRGSVSQATAERVRRAIDELGFRPSHAARVLLSGSSQMIGVYIPVLKGTFYTPLLQAIDTELRAAGLHMVVAFGCGSGDARQQAVEGIDFLIERGCDGLVVMSNALADEDVQGLIHRKSRMVILNDHFDSISNQCFMPDHALGGSMAARALLDKGHRRFAVISGPESSPDNVLRVNSFVAELGRHGIAATDVPIDDGDFSPEGGWASAQRLTQAGRSFSALFCANDEMAVGALCYFQENGIEVPGHISVLGYDDIPTAAFSAPRLTSVHIPWTDVTLNGLRWLLGQCYGSQAPVIRRFDISVTWRASVGRSPRTSTNK